jgi:hypothetical protein
MEGSLLKAADARSGRDRGQKRGDEEKPPDHAKDGEECNGGDLSMTVWKSLEASSGAVITMAVVAMTAEGKIALIRPVAVFGKAAWENGTAVILKRSLGLRISV